MKETWKTLFQRLISTHTTTLARKSIGTKPIIPIDTSWLEIFLVVLLIVEIVGFSDGLMAASGAGASN